MVGYNRIADQMITPAFVIMKMMSIEELKKEVEREVVKALNEHKQEIDDERAQEIASYVLTSLEGVTTFTDLVKIVEDFDNQYTELRSVVIYITNLYNQTIEKETLHKVDTLIHEQKIEEADKLLEGALKNEQAAGSTINTPQYTAPSSSDTANEDPEVELAEIANTSNPYKKS